MATICRWGLLMGLLLLLCFCGSGQKETDSRPSLFTDGQFHFALLTSPKTDCIACLNMAMRNLHKIVPPGQTIPILFKESSDTQDFKYYIEKKFPNRDFSYAQSSLNIMYPSIVLFKDQVVHMVFYISSDVYDLKGALDKSMEWFKGMQIK